jgi:hypothetical protein
MPVKGNKKASRAAANASAKPVKSSGASIDHAQTCADLQALVSVVDGEEVMADALSDDEGNGDEQVDAAMTVAKTSETEQDDAFADLSALLELPTEEDLDAQKMKVLTKLRMMLPPGPHTHGGLDAYDKAQMILDGAVVYITEQTNKDPTLDPVDVFEYIIDVDASCSQDDLWRSMKPMVKHILKFMGPGAGDSMSAWEPVDGDLAVFDGYGEFEELMTLLFAMDKDSDRRAERLSRKQAG